VRSEAGHAAPAACKDRSWLIGERICSAERRRSRLYSSIQAATPPALAPLVAKCSSERSSNSKVKCQDSITALSSADPDQPIDCRIPILSQALRNRCAV
jgi:hypothetical protein